MKTNRYLIFLFSFLFSYLIYFLFHSYNQFYYAVPIAVFSSLILLTYTSDREYFYLVLVGLAIFVFSGLIPINFSLQLISLSLLIQFLLIKDLSLKTSNFSSKLEIRRDIVQIVIGGISLFVLVFLYKQLLLGLILFGILVAHIMLVYGKKIKKWLNLLEREGVIFGSGAISMAVGVILLLGLINHQNFLFFSMFSLLISDPIATIAGLKIMKKHGNKSFIGSAAFFISSLIPGVIIFGVYGIIFAFVLMLAERFSPIDDNVFIAIIAVFLSFVFII